MFLVASVFDLQVGVEIGIVQGSNPQPGIEDLRTLTSTPFTLVNDHQNSLKTEIIGNFRK